MTSTINRSFVTPEISGQRASQESLAALFDQTTLVERSHLRSAAFGLQINQKPDLSPLACNDLAIVLQQNRTLHNFAVPVMETMFDHLRHTHSMVVLTDADGTIMHALGEDDFLYKAEKLAIRPGVEWSERGKGTNAIGTAIAERRATRIHAREHYLAANRTLTCSAAPIFDHRENVIGVLDITGDYRNVDPHTLALVKMSAQMIENQLFGAAFNNAVTLHFHRRAEAVGTTMEGIASFTPGGRFLAANRTALKLFDMPAEALQNHTFSSLFELPLSDLIDHHRRAAPGYLQLFLLGAQEMYARIELRLEPGLVPSADLPRRIDLVSHTPVRTASASNTPHLQSLATGDEKMAQAIAKVSKVLAHAIPILVTGETGTGKELLAQAIHRDSPRAAAPFVAVNCAAIPETLIESELFGYEEGAFTGARKHGKTGKILQANGGTLFLDEIGDMPLHLQGHLLRVLQERVVTPLGSDKSIPVNVAVICATNRKLRDMIADGSFREDLYYRLNGLVVKLPALRERTDLEAVVAHILRTESPKQRVSVAPQVMRLFHQYAWPGNFRQLANLLRTALILAGDTWEITHEHLPDDFLEDIVPTDEARLVETAELLPQTGQKLEDINLSVIQQTLEAHHGNVSATARALGVSRNTIYRKIQ
ncbi:MAG TPA: sigma-54-dependent Fis family transcriptional regulator [Burkholderiaceae bacterium]|jgi:transcriptional regulator of acetoin/glycerol metabolism